MDRSTFWAHAGRVRAQAGADIEAYESALRAELRGLSPEELVSFDQHLHQLVADAYHWKLWAAAYLINGGCSDDGFYYFRAWLVMQGQAIYETALADPDALADVCAVPNEDAECEEVLYVARQLYEEKTGQELTPQPLRGETPGDEPSGAPWDEDDLPELLPRLARIHLEE